ncbi:DUF742 domain-containing protein [Streptomyces sp. TLI_171]|uniref:DUF742 domain-containing protein n=1 Tax=Streptomyces sp. TLI_171 TaxID=1938859 RepID=UPI000C19A1A1|nr:DUF742 domain-containing protein [Streptomyces sp. TLI_171]RKE22048.1 uncharacterized protein DUF742 [Streptomyces sp. TLI_171]
MTLPPSPVSGPVGGQTSRLRPFLLTGGRAYGADAAIALETQVVSRQAGFDALGELAFESADIVRLCAVPLSVAEISARMRLHLGVVRVLVGDLAGAGLLDIHVPDTDAARNVNTILRVLHGLRAIS